MEVRQNLLCHPQAGVKMIADLAKEDIPFMHIGLTTSRKWMRERRARKPRFCPSSWTGDALHAYTKRGDPDNPCEIHQINDQGMLDGSIQNGYDFMEEIPLVKRQAFQVTLDQITRNNPKAKTAKPEQFFDNTQVQELINEGFYTKLWGKSP